MIAALRGRSLLFLWGLVVVDVVAVDDVFAVEDFWASCSGTLMGWSAAGDDFAGREEVDGSGGRPAIEVSGTPALRGEGIGSNV